MTPPAEATIWLRLRSVDKHAVSRLREADPRTRPGCGETLMPDHPLDVILVDPVECRPIGRPWLTPPPPRASDCALPTLLRRRRAGWRARRDGRRMAGRRQTREA
ncbi:MAG: hypothetical protein OXI87_17520 [Albidovulum sp.]|nr:hypothetical protein [Albidovulum sp.]